MKKYKTFIDMDVWKSSHKLVQLVYCACNDFPQQEEYGLSAQIKRAVVSVSSNIAEGYGRSGTKDKIRFYIIARASLSEVKSQCILALSLYKMNDELMDYIFSEINRTSYLLNRLIGKFK